MVRKTLDNVETKTRNHQQGILNEGLQSHIEILDGLYDSSHNYKIKGIPQTYVVFYKKYSGKGYKFVSQVSTQNVDAVKMYIDKENGIDLYIDPKNPANYYFDLHL